MARCLGPCDDLGAACHPYYTCARCGLDFDDETFYIRDRKAGSHGNRQRRLHDTICKGCRQQERDDAKGPAPIIEWSKIEFGRFLQAADRTIRHHAERLGVARHELTTKQNWERQMIAKRMATTMACEYCGRPFHSLDDQQIDVVVPRRGFAFELNTKVACGTCNNAKKAFQNADDPLELIQRWSNNYRRWVAHREKCAVARTIDIGTLTPIDIASDPDGQLAFGDSSFRGLPTPRAVADKFLASLPTPTRSGAPKRQPKRDPTVASDLFCPRCALQWGRADHAQCPRCGFRHEAGC